MRRPSNPPMTQFQAPAVPVAAPQPVVAPPQPQTQPEPQPQLQPPPPIAEAVRAAQMPARSKKRLPTIKLSLKRALFTAAALAIVGGGLFAAITFLRPASPVPPDIQAKLTYGIYLPKDEQVLKLEPNSITYSDEVEVLSYVAVRQNGDKVTFTQQATPESFTDVPQAYDKLLSSLQEYSSFDSVHGKVALTKPKELKGDQSAVMNANGTLLFIRPGDMLTNDEWRKIINALDLKR